MENLKEKKFIFTNYWKTWPTYLYHQARPHSHKSSDDDEVVDEQEKFMHKENLRN